MLWRGRRLGGWFLAIAFFEAIDASCRIDQLLFTGKERVAGRTNFDVQITLLGGASFERLAPRAGNCDFAVFWVNSWFHFIALYRRHKCRNYKRDMIGVSMRTVKFGHGFPRMG